MNDQYSMKYFTILLIKTELIRNNNNLVANESQTAAQYKIWIKIEGF